MNEERANVEKRWQIVNLKEDLNFFQAEKESNKVQTDKMLKTA